MSKERDCDQFNCGRSVDSHVRNLRRKIAVARADVDPIRSVYGVGYAFDWPPSEQ